MLVFSHGAMLDHGSTEWIRHWEATGRWFEPPYWREPEYLDNSCFSLEELETAFKALQRVFPPGRAKLIAGSRGSELFRLLYNGEPARLSSLVSLGLDLVTCQPWKSRKLLNDLAREDGYPSARFEIEVWAAWVRAGVPCLHEPFRAQKGNNPDFLVGIGGGLIMDAKFARRSMRVIEEVDLFREIMALEDLSLIGISRTVFFTQRMKDILATTSGRRVIQRKKQIIAQQVHTEVLRLFDGGTFPARTEIEELVQIEIHGPARPGLHGAFEGVVPDQNAEADRLIKNLLQDGAATIPNDRYGVVVIDIGDDGDADVVGVSVLRWMSGESEGKLYPNVVGAMLIKTSFVSGFPVPLRTFTRVWRESTPAELCAHAVWNSFGAGLNWQRLRHLEWRRRRRRESAT